MRSRIVCFAGNSCELLDGFQLALVLRHRDVGHEAVRRSWGRHVTDEEYTAAPDIGD